MTTCMLGKGADVCSSTLHNLSGLFSCKAVLCKLAQQPTIVQNPVKPPFIKSLGMVISNKFDSEIRKISTIYGGVKDCRRG